VQDERIGSNRGMLNISAAISPGNSGGLAVNDGGELIGIPTLIRDDTVPSMRPSGYATPLLDAARSGEEYISPYFHPLRNEAVGGVKLVAPGARVGISFECGQADLTSLDTRAVGVTFNYKGFDEPQQDLAVAVSSGSDLIGFYALDQELPIRWPAESGCATVTIPIDLSDARDPTVAPTVTVGIGPNYASRTSG
jgi:hypothetical protein